MIAAETVSEPSTRGFFNQENAKHYSALANKIRWANFRAAANQPKQVIPTLVPVEMPKTDRIRVKLEELMDKMDATDDPKELDMLSRAYDRLFKAWMVLSGTPGSGQRKPPPMPRARAQASNGPVVEMLPDATVSQPPQSNASEGDHKGDSGHAVKTIPSDPNEPNG